MPFNELRGRLDDIIEDKDTVTLKLSRSQYYYSLLTNRAPDYELDSGISIREAFEPGPYLMDLNKSKNLIICSTVLSLGISGVVLGGDTFSLSGTALALVAGIILNLILKENKA